MKLHEDVACFQKPLQSPHGSIAEASGSEIPAAPPRPPDPHIPNQAQRVHLEIILNKDFRRFSASFQPVPLPQMSSQKSECTSYNHR